MQERRNFQRINLVKAAEAEYSGHRVLCELHDISFKGALVAFDTNPPDLNEKVTLQLVLDAETHTQIAMQAHVAHKEDKLVGLQCEEISLDDMQTLRRLMELNLGEEDLLQRELSHLIRS